MNRELEAAFRAYVQAQARRVLTQMDRDPHSPSYGCFDRAWWHYKTADFASGVLQQGAELVEALRAGVIEIEGVPERDAWEAWTVAAVNALSRQAGRSGALDEYYPHEDSYPAAAFGLWTAVRLLRRWQDGCPRLLEKVEWKGLRRALERLGRRCEVEAANQYAAGVAALALAAGIEPLREAARFVEAHAGRLLALQHPEGWFPEYGGPDTGYLTVTLDALTDYLDATGDRRAAAAIERAVRFLAQLVGPDGTLPWTLNSRNTNYVLPYGLVRAARRNGTAAWLVATLFQGIDRPSHWIWSADDRYHCHYLYASVLRSLPHLREMTSAQPLEAPKRLWLDGCGYFILRSPTGRQALYVATRKGGSLRLHTQGAAARFDHGRRVRARSGWWVTDWWSAGWQARLDAGTVAVEGRMQACRFPRNTPWRQIALRAGALLAGRRIAPLLKRLLIRRGRARGPWFRREIRLSEEGFEVRDWSDAAASELAAAPRQNLRHVASAGWFDPEELAPPLGEGRLEFGVRWEETV
jgi:hypothetical protein